MTPFTIDGRRYDVSVVSLKRKAAVLDGPNAGRSLDAVMHRDILGTFYNYSVTLNTSNITDGEYDELYETLTAPVDSHLCKFPYGQGTITFEAYIANADDDLLRMAEGKNLWNNLTVDFVAKAPQRRP